MNIGSANSLRANSTQIKVTAGGGIFLAGNPKRVGIMFAFPSGFNISFSGNNAPVLNSDFTISNPVAPTWWRKKDFGDWVTRALFAISNAAVTVGVIEVIDEAIDT